MSSLALLIVVFTPSTTFASDTTCGDIITTLDGVDERTPITDCSDPFDLKTFVHHNFSYILNNKTLVAGETRAVATLPATLKLDTSEITGTYDFESFYLYHHEGNDYRLVDEITTNQLGTIELNANATGTYTHHDHFSLGL